MAPKAATAQTTKTLQLPLDDVGGHSGLPQGWRHSALVTWIQEQPREQRESTLAGLFALLAAVWAPLGILSFLARVFTIFFVVSLLVAVAVAAPRPTAVAVVSRTVREQVAPALQRAASDLAAALRHVRRELPGVAAELRDDLAPLANQVAASTRRVVGRAGKSLRSGWAHAREQLSELGPSPAQSNPRSAR